MYNDRLSLVLCWLAGVSAVDRPAAFVKPSSKSSRCLWTVYRSGCYPESLKTGRWEIPLGAGKQTEWQLTSSYATKLS